MAKKNKKLEWLEKVGVYNSHSHYYVKESGEVLATISFDKEKCYYVVTMFDDNDPVLFIDYNKAFKFIEYNIDEDRV